MQLNLLMIGIGSQHQILRHPVLALTMFGVSAPLGMLVATGVMASAPCARSVLLNQT